LPHFAFLVCLTGNLKEGKNEAVPEELGKMGYKQL
jgi:hypothetical protein